MFYLDRQMQATVGNNKAMRKLGLLTAVLALGLAMVAQAQTPPATSDVMAKAMEVAQKEKKSVWVIFSASW